MTRTPKECLLACIANLDMAEDASDAAFLKAKDIATPESKYAAAVHIGRSCAFQEAVDLIRTECASILQEPDHG